MKRQDRMFVTCPHCQGLIEVVEVNCGIFRHGWLPQQNTQLPPHASKEECEAALQNGLMGCGKPFELQGNQAVVCEYK